MRKIYSIVLLYTFNFLFSQDNPEISTGKPAVTPPSPTVSSLMKYQEVPVNNYTGVPDISIPLLQMPTHSKDLSVNLSLKYHSTNVKAENIASDVGLGWTVFAGGTISRVVRGLPDEEIVLASSGKSGKVGLYQNNITNHKNIYYSFSQDPLLFEVNNPEISNEYYWETVENNRYDTEHDLWQFNFMGNSGSFLIKKEGNILQVEPLSDYRLKIENHYSTINNQDFTPTGFTVYDEKGYKYVFSVFETTTRSVDTQSLKMIMNDYSTSTGHSDERPFRSSFHLTNVIDPNNKTVFSIDYDERELIESNLQSTFTVNEYGSDPDSVFNAARYNNCWSELPPMKITKVSNSIIKVKKIKHIVIPDQAKIEFVYFTGRSDTNVNPNTTYLGEIKLLNINNNNNNVLYKYIFDYDYNTVIYNRMFLKSLTKSFTGNSQPEKHEFFYKRNTPQGLPPVIAKDAWGYFNTFNFENCIAQDITFMREASPQISTLELLQKIKYPTGGSSIFEFEANKYSFIGNQQVTNYESNPLNTSFLGTDSYYFNSNQIQPIPVYNKDRKVVIYPSIVLQSDPNTWTNNISLIKIVNGQNIIVGSIYCVEPNSNCCFEFTLEKNTTYAFRRNNFDINYHETDNLTINYYVLNENNRFLYGGGNRIAKIAYFEMNAPQNYYEQPNTSISFSKERRFSYTMPEDPTKSSGSLVFGKPKYEEYKFVSQNATNCSRIPYAYCHTSNDTLSYLSRFTNTNQETVSTHGADVGYKYVREEQVGLGSLEQIFTSPIDYPEEELITYTKPYLPSKNIDYKRGLLIEHKTKDQTGRLLSHIFNTYHFIDYEKLYGYRFDKPDGISFQGRFSDHSYMMFKFWSNSTQPSVLSNSGPGCYSQNSFDSFSRSSLGVPKDDIQYYPLKQAYGWSQLTSKNTKNYFYENGNQKITEKNESFSYNPVNKQISEHIADTEDGTQLKTKYFYHSGNSTYSQNRISEIEKIESYSNGKLLDTKKVNYANNWTSNVSYLPQSIQSSFGTGNPDTELIYDQYDSKGNLLQYTTKDGITTSIIWGYNTTQPITKITGATYAQVSSPASAIIAASDADALDPANEPALINALDAFRKNPDLAAYQITTYTYDPMIGVTGITPPSGIREVYLYDTANRLKEIRENNATGKILKEFKYNYKH